RRARRCTRPPLPQSRPRALGATRAVRSGGSGPGGLDRAEVPLRRGGPALWVARCMTRPRAECPCVRAEDAGIFYRRAQSNHWFGRRRGRMRVRLQHGGSGSELDALLPITGHVLHPETNRAEWAIIALGQPVSVRGSATELLLLRPARAGEVGASAPSTVH